VPPLNNGHASPSVECKNNNGVRRSHIVFSAVSMPNSVGMASS